VEIPNNKSQITKKIQQPSFKIPNYMILKKGKRIEKDKIIVF